MSHQSRSSGARSCRTWVPRRPAGFSSERDEGRRVRRDEAQVHGALAESVIPDFTERRPSVHRQQHMLTSRISASCGPARHSEGVRAARNARYGVSTTCAHGNWHASCRCRTTGCRGADAIKVVGAVRSPSRHHNAVVEADRSVAVSRYPCAPAAVARRPLQGDGAMHPTHQHGERRSDEGSS